MNELIEYLKNYQLTANPVNQIATKLTIASILEIGRKNKELIKRNNELEKLIKEL